MQHPPLCSTASAITNFVILHVMDYYRLGNRLTLHLYFTTKNGSCYSTLCGLVFQLVNALSSQHAIRRSYQMRACPTRYCTSPRQCNIRDSEVLLGQCGRWPMKMASI